MLGMGYGECKNKKKFSKEYRGRGGVIVDDHVLIDAPSDIFDVASNLGFDEIFNTVTDILISHSHDGHFSAAAVDRIAEKKKVRIFASREVLSRLSDNPNIEKYEIDVFMQFKVGKYTVATMPTNHSTSNLSETCFNFLLVGERCLFYALDGGFINSRAFNILKQLKLDAIICDAALENDAPSERSLYHNDIPTLVRMKSVLESVGITGEKTRYILAHVPTDKKREVHFELAPVVAKHGMVLAYDGYFARI